MDKNQFLSNLRKSTVPLVAVPIQGWDGPVYLRATTIGEIRDILLGEADSPGESGNAAERAQRDPLYLARQMAKLVRDENGNLLFNHRDDAEMQELMDAMAGAAPYISKQIQKAYERINTPTSQEEDSEGN